MNTFYANRVYGSGCFNSPVRGTFHGPKPKPSSKYKNKEWGCFLHEKLNATAYVSRCVLDNYSAVCLYVLLSRFISIVVFPIFPPRLVCCDLF